MDRVEPLRTPVLWILRMAWRDTRGRRRLLGLFTLCVVFGIAAIVAIDSLRSNLERIIDLESRELLGADLVLQSRRPMSEEVEALVRRLGGEQAREIRFRSMAQFPDTSNEVPAGRLVQVRALEGRFPFYGEMVTEPAGASLEDGLIVEQAMMDRAGMEPGAVISLGGVDFRTGAALVRVAGESEVSGFFAPRIYIDRAALPATGLVQEGSVVRHLVYLQFDDGLTGERLRLLEEAEEGLLVREGIRVTRVEDRQEAIREVLGNIFNFLNLVGFIALLLGGIGVGGAVQVYIRGKLNTVAVLRCLGTPMRAAVAVYLVQIMAAGSLGATIGALLGVAVQAAFPLMLADFLPFEVELRTSWSSVAGGLFFGWFVTALFGLIPLLGVRRISPLLALRAGVEPLHVLRRDPLFWILMLVLGATTVTYAVARTTEWIHGVAFAAALGAALALLAGVGLLLRRVVRWAAPANGPYALRLALSNLHRPNNRTLFLIVSLGMGAFLISTLYLVRASLLGQVRLSSPGEAANVILLDVQSDQVEGLSAFLAARGEPARDVLPVVTMRLQAINGRSMEEIRNDPSMKVEDWVYSWEFRNTWRDHLLDNAEVIRGEFVGRYDGPEPIPVSVAESLLDDIPVDVGDTLTWNVQGLPVRTVVSSIRRIDWSVERQNFGVVFPLGFIESAPAVYAVTTAVAGRAGTAALQADLASAYPNVSILDLTLIYETVSDLLTRAAFVIQFMAGFTVFTGLIVLASAVWTSRYQRISESVLLRTLGASAAFIRSVLSVEFLLLGTLAAMSGIGLGCIAAWAAAKFVFRTSFVMEWPLLGGIAAAVVLLTALTGLMNSRGIASHPPLAVLREEGR